ncbi:MAG TPA: hypothetical protein VF300_03315 [Methanothrix sp.]
MQNKKEKRVKGAVGKTVASGSADAKKEVADVGTKGTPGKTEAKKGWKK